MEKRIYFRQDLQFKFLVLKFLSTKKIVLKPLPPTAKKENNFP